MVFSADRLHCAPVVAWFVGAALALSLGTTPLDAQFYFGRNKVQYDDFDWQVLETPHFLLYYYSEEETVARAAAYWAEETFVDLEQKFNHTLRRKVPLVIYSNHSHFQQTNTTPSMLPEGVGGFFEFLKGRVVLPYRGSMYDLWHVVRHELVHVFMHSKINASGNRVGSWERRMPPAWFTEGLAEYWSVGWDSQAEMVIRDALLHDHLFPVENLTVSGAGFLVYKEGQSFSKFLEEEYGADVIRQIMDEFYHHESFEEVVEAVTSKPFAQLSKQWRLGLKKSTAQQLLEERLPGDGLEMFTEQLGANVAPTLYIDAEGERHVVYLSSRDGYASVYKQALSSSKASRLLRGERTSDLESLHFLQSGLGVSNSGVLAFVAKSFDRDHIRLVDIESGETVGEFSDQGLITLRSPTWSPDGKQVVFSAQDKGGQSDLYLWHIDSTTATALTHDFYLDRDPAFDPTGRAILFASDRGRPILDSGTSIYRYDIASGELQALTTGPHRDIRPRQSAAGDSLIQFISDRSGTPNVWQIADNPNIPLSISPVTNLHTGAVDFMTLPGDSLLLTTFEEYSFQIQVASKENIASAGSVVIPRRAAAFSAYSVPRYDASSGDDSQPYRRRYSLDFAQTALTYSPVFGALGGLQMSISDILGNRYHHILLANSAERLSEYTKHPNIAFTSVNLSRRLNYAVGAFQFAREFGSFYDLSSTYFERARGVRGGVVYPLDVFKRVELNSTTWRSRRTYYFPKERKETALLTNMYASFVHDNALWYGVGPFDGWRFRATTGMTYNHDTQGIRNYQLLLDNRIYYRLSSRVALAQRTTLGLNSGRDTYRSFIGGSWGMRGYRINEVVGRRYIMFNQEVRFPFANSLALRTNNLAIGFAPIRGALFLDIGNAWETTRPAMIGSFGFGLRGLFLGGIVLRMDVGRKFNLENSDRPGFVKYFFGWDF